jgi:hypothetical protein
MEERTPRMYGQPKVEFAMVGIAKIEGSGVEYDRGNKRTS